MVFTLLALFTLLAAFFFFTLFPLIVTISLVVVPFAPVLVFVTVLSFAMMVILSFVLSFFMVIILALFPFLLRREFGDFLFKLLRQLLDLLQLLGIPMLFAFVVILGEGEVWHRHSGENGSDSWLVS